MKLSMNMLAWYMQSFDPVCSVINDDVSIKGLRFLSEKKEISSSEYVYFGAAENYFSDRQYKNAYIIVYKKNYLLFPHADHEELLNALLSSFDFFNDWERRLLEETAAGGSLQDIIDISEEIIQNPSMVGDIEGNVLAYSWGFTAKRDSYWEYVIKNKRPHPSIVNKPYYDLDGKLVLELGNEPKLINNALEGGDPLLMSHLFQDEQAVATYFVLQSNPEYTQLNEQLMTIISGYLLLSREFLSDEPMLRSDESVFRAFLNNDMNSDDYGIKMSEKLKAISGCPKWHLAVLAQAEGGNLMQEKMIYHHIKEIPGYLLPVIIDNKIYTLISDENINDLPFDTFGNEYFSNTTIAVSIVNDDFFSLYKCRIQADFAFEKAAGKSGIYRCEDFAKDYLIEKLKEDPMSSVLIHPAVRILEKYDAQRQGELKKTLSVYLESRLNLVESAKKLNIHKNTLKYRINKIKELTGCDLKNTDELDYIQLSGWLSR